MKITVLIFIFIGISRNKINISRKSKNHHYIGGLRKSMLNYETHNVRS